MSRGERRRRSTTENTRSLSVMDRRSSRAEKRASGRLQQGVVFLAGVAAAAWRLKSKSGGREGLVRHKQAGRKKARIAEPRADAGGTLLTIVYWGA